MPAISQTTHSNAFVWMKILWFQSLSHWSLFLMVQSTIYQHWFRYLPGVDQAPSHYLIQWWLDYRCIYASLNELTKFCMKTCIKSDEIWKFRKKENILNSCLMWRRLRTAPNRRNTKRRCPNSFRWATVWIYSIFHIKTNTIHKLAFHDMPRFILEVIFTIVERADHTLAAVSNYQFQLIHIPLDKQPPFRRWYFQMYFRKWKFCIMF